MVLNEAPNDGQPVQGNEAKSVHPKEHIGISSANKQGEYGRTLVPGVPLSMWEV